ncbi:hypothetical protein Tco_1428327 [Tanacetum coccineum]
MAALKFASSYNMVAFLDKPTESDGFKQIVKTVNGEVQIQALVDKKKVIITEISITCDNCVLSRDLEAAFEYPEVNAAKVRVTAAKHNLVLLVILVKNLAK